MWRGPRVQLGVEIGDVWKITIFNGKSPCSMGKSPFSMENHHFQWENHHVQWENHHVQWENPLVNIQKKYGKMGENDVKIY
jgi:hypothetical protein